MAKAQLLTIEDLTKGLLEDQPPVKEELNFAGLQIAIEYKRGEYKPDHSFPTGYDVKESISSGYMMHADYGYIKDTLTNDSEPMDCFIGPERSSTFAAIAFLYQRNEFNSDSEIYQPYQPCIDEPKVLLGFKDMDQAVEFICLQYGRDHVFAVCGSSIKDLQEDVSLQQERFRKEYNYLVEHLVTGVTSQIDVGEEVGEYGQAGEPQLIVSLS